MPSYRVRFLPQNQSAVFPAGTTFRDAALALGILIDSTCAGIGTCGKCKVEVKSGGNGVTAVETDLLSAQELAKGVRLACRASVATEALCVVPPASLAHFDGDTALLDAGADALDPDVQITRLELPPPALGDNAFHAERLCAALARNGIIVKRTALPALRMLAALPPREAWQVRAVTHDGVLIAVLPGDDAAKILGAAVDIGTTSVAVKLIDLERGEVLAAASALNAQAAYGADVVARVQFCVQKPAGTRTLHRTFISQLNELLQQLATQAGATPQHIYRVLLAGNTVMQHLALNINPASLGVKPFAPVLLGPLTLSAAELGLAVQPSAPVTALPNLGAFVGSDITALLTVLDLDQAEGIQLAVDMGTNGEIVLGNRERLLCGSSPAGPAWEGACMRWGMRAAPGAIERAEISDGDLQLRTIAQAAPVGICGSGLIDLVSEFRRAGLIEASGRILPPDRLPAAVPDALRRRVSTAPGGAVITIAETADGTPITLSQADVREFQLAKAAIAAGVQVLMRELGIAASEIERVYIAGAFGNHIRSQDVIDLGLLPKVPAERIHFAGNAALAGATAALRSQQRQAKAIRLSRSIGYVEISGRADFQETFVDAMPLQPNDGAEA